MAKSGSNSGFWKTRGGSGALALDFSPEAIALYERGRGNTWNEIGRAQTDADDFSEQVDALRVEALVRDKRQSPVTLWLPSDQIIERHYQLQATSDDGRRAEAARRIASETSHLAPELSIAVADGSRTEPVKVLAVLLQTMIEARSYAANWGFNPGPISTRVSADGFSSAGPVFDFPHSAVQRAGRTARRAAIAAVALGAVGAAALGGYHLIQPLLQQPVEVRSSGPAPSSFAVFLDPPRGPHAPLRAVETTPAGNLAMQRLRLRSENFEPGLGTLTYARIGETGTPAVLTAPNGAVPLRVGTAPAIPEIGELAALGAAPTEPATAAIAAFSPEAGEEAEDLTPTEFAPETMALAPIPRPATPEATEPDAETASTDAHSDPAIPLERPADIAADAETETDTSLTETPPAEDKTATEIGAEIAATDPAGTADETDAAAEETAVEKPSVFAAIEAPAPSKRPRALEFAAKRLPRRSATPLSVYLPSSVKDAAKRTGLILDKTNLIGIIDAKSGRQALLRLSDGDFRKVSRGDKIDGWRVSAIGREAVRLSRQGQHRTLLLVSP